MSKVTGHNRRKPPTHMSEPIASYVYRHFDLLLVGFFIKTSPKCDSRRENEGNVRRILDGKRQGEDPGPQLIMSPWEVCGVIKNYPTTRRGVSYPEELN